jgi:DNA helicase-2/ATP-dependent DNA helicase PcrA
VGREATGTHNSKNADDCGMNAISSDTLLLNTDRHVRVNAGPGAGKTYWLAEHTKNVVRRSKKIHPLARIAVISYTNIAADELRQKLGSDAAKAEIGTIHNFLYRIVIKPYLYLIRDGNGQSIVNTALMDGHDEHHVNHKKVEAWLTSVNYRTALRDKKQTDVIKRILATVRWKQDDDPAHWTLEVNPPAWLDRQLWRPMSAKITADSLLVYKTLYWADGVLDHDDVLYFASRIFREYPLIVSCFSARYPFLFIDEFQDTVPAQTNIVRLLAEQGTTVVIIGDAEQSIFTFAGAHPEHFYSFTLPGLDEYTIADNRRSTDRIVALLNHVRSDKIIQRGVRATEGDPVMLLIGGLAGAVQRAKTLLPHKESLLIVARNDSFVQQAQALNSARTTDPWDAVGDADGDRKIFLHQLLAGVFLARKQRYGSAVETILRGIRHTNGKLKDPLQSPTPRSTQQRRAIAITLLEALIGLGPAFDSMSLRAAYEHCRKTLMTHFADLTIKQIRSGRFLDVSEKQSCDALLLTVSLSNSEEIRDARTIHQAKGTERQNVLVCLNGRDEAETQEHLNHILHPRATSDEEQRITYVGISRARDRLFLAAPILTAEQELRARELGFAVLHLETQ